MKSRALSEDLRVSNAVGTCEPAFSRCTPDQSRMDAISRTRRDGRSEIGTISSSGKIYAALGTRGISSPKMIENLLHQRNNRRGTVVIAVKFQRFSFDITASHFASETLADHQKPVRRTRHPSRSIKSVVTERSKPACPCKASLGGRCTATSSFIGIPRRLK